MDTICSIPLARRAEHVSRPPHWKLNLCYNIESKHNWNISLQVSYSSSHIRFLVCWCLFVLIFCWRTVCPVNLAQQFYIFTTYHICINWVCIFWPVGTLFNNCRCHINVGMFPALSTEQEHRQILLVAHMKRRQLSNINCRY